MRAITKFVFPIFILLILGVAGVVIYSHLSDIAVLDPKGLIASKERDLMLTATLLMLVVVIPVFILTFFIAWKYRAGNTKARYTPDWDHHRPLELTWWAIPAVIITVLAVITWIASHELDPFKPIDQTKKPMTIQVVALQWKWLFIYPEQNIASVNLVQFPEKTPINFEITSDAPMNSFWIPRLGGQVYAMAGMKTMLHLEASAPGSFNGSSANLSGKGFAGMKFVAKSSTTKEFELWVQSSKKSSKTLTLNEYNQLSKPSENNTVVYYSLSEKNLYDEIVMKYMMPVSQMPSLVQAGGTP